MYWYRVFAWVMLSMIPISLFAAGPVDHFEVVLNQEESLVDEALDITITAVDKNGEVVSDYLGDILVFSESDVEAEFPNDLAENSYSFITANEGSVKFENAVKFHNTGVQDVYVYDLNDENIFGVAEITIKEWEKQQNVEIEILSPENNVTLGKNTIDISWATKKNHQVKILINNKEEVFTTSNSDGIFEQEIPDLQEWTNTFQAFILDADENVIGESEKINIKINASLPQFKSITVTPTGEVEAQSEIHIQVVSNIGLSNVSVIIDDLITPLEEVKDGIYEATSLAPKEPGTYPIDVILKDDFWHDTQERWVTELIVIPALNASTVVIEVPEEDETPPPTPVVLKELDLTISNIQVTELKTKSILTWQPLDDATSYNIYKKIGPKKIELIANVTEPRYEIPIAGGEETWDDFAIKAVGETEAGEPIQGDLSEMTKVKTGPELYIFLAIIALLLTSGMFFMKRSKG